MLDLLNNLDKGPPSKQKNVASSQLAQSSSRLPESEFSSTGVKNAGLTLDALMGGITDTKGFGRVQKAFKDIASVPTDGKSEDGKKILETTKAPVAKIVSERASRKVHYEETSGDAQRWTGVVKQNREAETLDFRPKDRMNIDREDLVGKFEATTDFEKEVAEALEKAGAESEKDIARRERAELMGEDGAYADDDDAMAGLDDDLGGNRISLEEYKKRHGELAKMRALMFYEEQKRHHMNKIKSKKYRKIRKKQRERRSEAEKEAATEEDPDLVRELEEKEEMERMKERMSLRHKNTSKWAKQQLRRGKNIDTDTRRALSAQIQQGQDLRNKMNATMDRLNADSSDEEGASMLDQARAILADTEKDDEESGDDKKGLFSLAFMKRGMEAQRARAKNEARQLLMELEANESGSSDGSGEESGDDESNADETKKAKKPKTLSASETEKLLPKGKLVASALEFGNANAISVGGAIDVDLGDGSPPGAEAASDDDGSDQEDGADIGAKRVTAHTSTMRSGKNIMPSDVATGDEKPPKKTPASKRSKRKAALVEEAKKDEAANPWVAAASQDDDGDGADNVTCGKKKKKRLAGVSKDGVVNIQGAHALLGGDDDDSSEDENKMVLQEGGAKKVKEGGVASLSQDELVRRAFATATEDDIDDEFEREKEAMRERDDPTRKAKEETKVASGWGSWAGEGAPAPKPPRRLPKKLQPPEKKERRKRKDDMKKRVIINEKRVKRTAQFQLAEIPYPFTSREQYEKAMAGSIGAEWNVSGAVKDLTRPEVLTRAGKIIQPISKRAKAKRAPAKF